MARVGVLGATGYVGRELLALIATHPYLDLGFATAREGAGRSLEDAMPGLHFAFPGTRLGSLAELLADPGGLSEVDAVFLALPHGESQRVVPRLLDVRTDLLLVDLAADFRLRERRVYEAWYHEKHVCPELLDQAIYGMPELNRQEMVAAADELVTSGRGILLAAPGCYPTAASLVLAPLVQSGMLEAQGIIVDAASGISGAGHKVTPATGFSHANEDFCAYGLLDHRHTPEIEQACKAEVIFTPHLAPMTRGILATVYARPSSAGSMPSTEDVLQALSDRYVDEPFVWVSEASPSTKETSGSNTAHLSARVDKRTGWVVLLAAIDNLVKGASGQAIQGANICMGFDETAGLRRIGSYP